MIARVTSAEIDPIRTTVDEAIEVFRDSVVPALHEQDGFEGVYLPFSPEGKALALTFWRDEEAAEAGLAGGGASMRNRSRSSSPSTARRQAVRRTTSQSRRPRPSRSQGAR
jgi:heme-degrading monooxygenase HmoA